MHKEKAIWWQKGSWIWLSIECDVMVIQFECSIKMLPDISWRRKGVSTVPSFGISNLALNALFRVSPSQKEVECLRKKTDKCCFVNLTTTVFEIKVGDANHSAHH